MRCPECGSEHAYRYKQPRNRKIPNEKPDPRTIFTTKCGRCKYEGREPYENIVLGDTL